MRLYLDDIRIPIEQDFAITRDYYDCIDKINNNNIEFLSLDHDLGLGIDKTGYDVAKYLVENDIRIPWINVHSQNAVGVQNIVQLLHRYFPETRLTKFKFESSVNP